MFLMNYKWRIWESIIYLVMMVILLMIHWIPALVFGLLFTIKFYYNYKYILKSWDYDSLHFTKTEDSWKLALYNYQPKQKNKLYPIVLCHGLASNHLFWDLQSEISLPKYLTAYGYDIWSVDIRSCGNSIYVGDGKRSKKNFSFDEMIEGDVPAIINYVLKQTGQEKLIWIGHSMGGMIISSYIARFPDIQNKLESIVLIGSPLDFNYFKESIFARLGFLQILKKSDFYITSKMITEWFSPLGVRINTKLRNMQINAYNMDSKSLLYYVYNAMEDLPTRLISQFLQNIKQGNWSTVNNAFSYQSHLSNIKIPTLLLVGGQDGLAPLSAARIVYDSANTQNKQMIVLSKETDFSADYGHGDLIMGKESKKEVFPLLLEWLEDLRVE